jgi:hypothetical protein
MRINPQVKQQRIDMNGEVRIPNCEPQQLKVVAERLMKMLIDREEELDATPYRYNTVTELDKQITVDYWIKYDGLHDLIVVGGFRDWFVKSATEMDIVTRARRWLIAHRYFFLKEGVVDRAQQAGDNFSKAIKNKRR